MLRRIRRALHRYRRLLAAARGGGAWACIMDDVLGRERLRAVRIDGYDIQLRSATPDLNVAISSLFEKEYANIDCAAPNVIIDAGANIGTSSVYFAAKYPDALILAIEPESSNFELLVLNTGNYGNVIPIKAAIGGSTDHRSIRNRHTGPWGYTVSETDNESDPLGQTVDCVTIPQLMNEHDVERISILKMDIEGGEKNVLENSADWIDSVDIMTVELHDRICMGCDRAFYLATKDFVKFERHGEKVTAYKR